MSVDFRPTVDAPDDDPYLWLEEVEGARAAAWVDAQNARTVAAFGGPAVEQDATTLAAIFDRPDKIPIPGRRGTVVVQFLERRGASARPLAAHHAESFRPSDPQWDVLIDLDALAAAEGEDWIWSGAATRPVKHDRAIVRPVARRQRCGRAARVRSRDEGLRVRRLRRCPRPRATRAGSTTTPCCWPAPMAATSRPRATPARCGCGGAARSRKRRRCCSRCRPTSMSASGGVDRTDPERPIWFYDQVGFFDVQVWRGRRRQLDLPTGVQPRLRSAAGSRSSRARTGPSAAAPGRGDSLLGIRLDAFLAGDRDFDAAVRAAAAARADQISPGTPAG